MSVSKWFKRLVLKFRAWRDDVKAAIEEAAKPRPEPGTETPHAPTGEWPLACTRIEAAMVTPLFVMRDTAQVKAQAKALKAGGFNAVASLIDLQSGRDYIFPGRTATALDPKCRENIERVLDAGITPLIMLKNDWAVWGAPSSTIPSINGQPRTQAAFYASDLLANDKRLLASLKDLFPYVHFQLSIEPQVAESAGFALALAGHLREAGFQGRIIVNPVGAALAAHQAIQGALDEAGCEIASSWHAATPPPYRVWNTDGRPDINAGNAQAVLSQLRAHGEFILWSQQLANSPTGIPAGYLAAGTPAPVPTPSEPVQAGDNTFLWKPVSESRQGRCAVITPANLTLSKVHVAGANNTAEYAGRANGNRQHWFQNKTGSAFGANVKVEAFDKASGKIIRTWTVPNGAARWGSN
jgi:hypothetical protein